MFRVPPSIPEEDTHIHEPGELCAEQLITAAAARTAAPSPSLSTVCAKATMGEREGCLDLQRDFL